MKNKKLVVVDYDSTIHVADLYRKIDGLNKEELQKQTIENVAFINWLIENDYDVLLTTGRGYNSIKKECEKFDLKYSFLGCNDGAELYYANDEIIYQKTIDEEDLKFVYEAEGNFNIDFARYIYPKGVTDKSQLCALKMMEGNEEKFADLEKFFKENLKHSNYYAHYPDFRVLHKTSNKIANIEKLLQINNFEAEDVVTIGDGPNDISMLKNYESFTFTYAEDRVKQVSDNVVEYLSHIKQYF